MTENGALLLSVAEAAKLLGIGRGLAYDLIAEGRLPSLRLGRRLLVPRFALEQWIAQEVGVPQSAGVSLTPTVETAEKG